MSHAAWGEEQPPWENRASDGGWKCNVRAPGFRNDVLLLYFSMSVFCGSFCIHYLYFESKLKWCIFKSIFINIFNSSHNWFIFLLYIGWCFEILNSGLQRIVGKLFFFFLSVWQIKQNTPHEVTWVVCDGNWWVHPAHVVGGRGQSRFSATHLLSSLLPYLDQKQQLENQVLWLIVTFSADYRGALG